MGSTRGSTGRTGRSRSCPGGRRSRARGSRAAPRWPPPRRERLSSRPRSASAWPSSASSGRSPWARGGRPRGHPPSACVEASRTMNLDVSAPVLEARDLHVWFDLDDGGKLHAVQGVSFALAQGERFGLVGESGCGKTTTILALMGLLPPSATVSGEVSVGGVDILSGG